MNKFTAGPWSMWQNEQEKGTNFWRIKTSNKMDCLDTIQGYCGKPNAQLIIASPDMYEALTMVVMALDLAKKTMPVNMRVAVESFVLPAIQKVKG